MLEGSVANDCVAGKHLGGKTILESIENYKLNWSLVFIRLFVRERLFRYDVLFTFLISGEAIFAEGK